MDNTQIQMDIHIKTQQQLLGQARTLPSAVEIQSVSKDERIKQVKKRLKKVMKNDLKLSLQLSQQTMQQNKYLQPIKQQSSSQTPQTLQFFNQSFFSGKLYTLWLFIFKKITQQSLSKIKQIYDQFSNQQNYVIPFCRTIQQALPFFKAQQAYFKVLIDIENAQQLIKRHKLFDKIAQMHVYNSDSQQGKQRFDRIRLQGKKKVRALYQNIDPLLEQIKLYIANCHRFLMIDEQICQANVRFNNLLPAYKKLTGQDKSQITKYRVNLYALINLTDLKQRKQLLQSFASFVRRVYCNNQNQLENLDHYLKGLNHIRFDSQSQRDNSRILEFYAKETFYYGLTNTMLRVSREIQEFRPISIPFSQTYNAIKFQYMKQTRKNKAVRRGLKVYRGAPFEGKKDMKKGDYIQLLGFISTSTDEKVASQFAERSNVGCLIIIQIPEEAISQDMQKFDHGYVDMNEKSFSTFRNQKQVLINALNIFKVEQIVPRDQNNQFDKIYLNYGAIFKLERQYHQNESSLSRDQLSVIKNYHYCKKLINNNIDQIDLLILNQELDKAKEKLKKQLKKNNSIQTKIKLANVQYLTGQAQNSLVSAKQVIRDVLVNTSKQALQAVMQNHQKIVSIFKLNDDNLNAQKIIDIEINSLDEETQWLLKASKHYQLGGVSFSQGSLSQCQLDLQQSQDILLGKVDSFEQRRRELRRQDQRPDSFLSNFGSCFRYNRIRVSQQKIRQQEQKIQNQQEEFKRKYGSQTYLLLINVTLSFLKYYDHVGSKKQVVENKFQKGKRLLQAYEKVLKEEDKQSTALEQLRANLLNYSSEASIVQKSQQILIEAIQKIQQLSPLDQKLGQLTSTLAQFKTKQYMGTFNQPSNKSQLEAGPGWIQDPLVGEDQQFTRIPFDTKQQIKITQEAEKIYQKCITIYSHCKSDDHLQVLSIRNKFSEFFLESKSTFKSIQQANLVLNTQRSSKHTVGALAALLLSKNYFSRGQIAKAFQSVILSNAILKIAIIKQQGNPEYQKQFQLSQIYIQIELTRIKLYNKQKRHDLALIHLQQIEIIAIRKLNDVGKVSYLSNIYEQKGNTYALLKQQDHFLEFYLKAIDLRTQQKGQTTMNNAICLCTIAKYLIYFGNYQEASHYLMRAYDIFSKFPYDHPNSWVPYSAKAYLNQKKGQKQSQIMAIRRSAQIIQKRFQPTHINYILINLKYSSVLRKNSNYEKAIKILNSLKQILSRDSSIDEFDWVQPEKQNEKVCIKKSIDQSLRSSQQIMMKSTASSPMKRQDIDIQSNQEIKKQMQNEQKLPLQPSPLRNRKFNQSMAYLFTQSEAKQQGYN